MAKIPDGILGKFLGKAGPVSGYMRNGHNYLRTSTRRKVTNITPGQLAQQQKIKICNEFTRAFTGSVFFKKTFPAPGDSSTGYNRVTSALMKLALIGSYPNIHISYPLVQVARGGLPVAENAAATLNNEGNIAFTWADNSGTGVAKGNDKAVLLAYFSDTRLITYTIKGASREDCHAVLATNSMYGSVAETWISFLNNDENDAANSIYTGTIYL